MTHLTAHSHWRLSATLLAVVLTSSADLCFGQIWIMRKPKPMIDEQKRQQQEAKPKKRAAEPTERTPQRPADPQLVMTSDHWRVTLSRCRAQHAGEGTAGASSAHCLVEAKIEKRSSDASTWFFPQWIALWDRSQGEPGNADAAPRVTLPLHAIDGDGTQFRGPLKVEEVRRITLVFRGDAAAQGSGAQIRFLDLGPLPLARIRTGD